MLSSACPYLWYFFSRMGKGKGEGYVMYFIIILFKFEMSIKYKKMNMIYLFYLFTLDYTIKLLNADWIKRGMLGPYQLGPYIVLRLCSNLDIFNF